MVEYKYIRPDEVEEYARRGYKIKEGPRGGIRAYFPHESEFEDYVRDIDEMTEVILDDYFAEDEELQMGIAMRNMLWEDENDPVLSEDFDLERVIEKANYIAEKLKDKMDEDEWKNAVNMLKKGIAEVLVAREVLREPSYEVDEERIRERLREGWARLIDEVKNSEIADIAFEENEKYPSILGMVLAWEPDVVLGNQGYTGRLLGAYYFFRKLGFEKGEARSLTRGFLLMNIWSGDDYFRYSGNVEDIFQACMGNGRPLRIIEEGMPYERFIMCADVRSYVKFVQSYFKDVLGMNEVTVFRGLNDFESGQVLASVIEGKPLKIEGTLGSFSAKKDVAEMFAQNAMVMKSTVSVENIVGCWLNAWLGAEEFEMIINIPKGGLSVEYGGDDPGVKEFFRDWKSFVKEHGSKWINEVLDKATAECETLIEDCTLGDEFHKAKVLAGIEDVENLKKTL